VKSELDLESRFDTLSPDTIRKVHEIERLAHAVKEKMSINPSFQIKPVVPMHGTPARSIMGLRLKQEVLMRGDTMHSPLAGMFRRTVVGFLFVAGLACIAQDSRPPAAQADKPPTTQAPTAPSASEPQAADASKMTKQQKVAAADNERKKQLTDESAQLLSMALALKAEVDKTTKDTLSINVIRKADEIEKLARNVKEKMKQKPGN
jgi:hypothetical protein